MEVGCSSSSSRFFLQHNRVRVAPPFRRIGSGTTISVSTRTKRKAASILSCFSVSYHKFVDFALNETRRHTHLLPSPLQEKYSSMNSKDGKGQLSMLSFQAAKIRLLRSLIIESETMQVLDFTVFPKAEYDVPIFCANFFTTARTNIVVLFMSVSDMFLIEKISMLLDLNPLHDIINQCEYKEKYFKSLIPLGLKYAELFPWGGKLTSESIKFFSPIVIWTKFTSSPQNYDVLYSAFMDYYKVWLELVGKAVKETDDSQILHNLQAQHRYLTWRAEKDLLRGFLFNGVDELGSKKFNDYFPHYCFEGGTLNKRGSTIGKSFEDRPWDARGEFLGE